MRVQPSSWHAVIPPPGVGPEKSLLCLVCLAGRLFIQACGCWRLKTRLFILCIQTRVLPFLCLQIAIREHTASTAKTIESSGLFCLPFFFNSSFLFFTVPIPWQSDPYSPLCTLLCTFQKSRPIQMSLKLYSQSLSCVCVSVLEI